MDVPLGKAREITGVRAVFGETYPDPVRVVSVGVPVEKLLESPGSAEWAKYSIEFCGGTHVYKTADIKDLVVLEESAIAKGIRRIVAVTGDLANASQLLAASFSRRLEHLRQMPHSSQKEAEVKAAGVELPQLGISAVRKAEYKEQYTVINKEVLDRVKAKDKAEAESAIKTVSTYFEQHPDAKAFVGVIDSISANPKALTAAINAAKTEKTRSIFLFGSEKEKIAHACFVSKVITPTLQINSNKTGS